MERELEALFQQGLQRGNLGGPLGRSTITRASLSRTYAPNHFDLLANRRVRAGNLYLSTPALRGYVTEYSVTAASIAAALQREPEAYAEQEWRQTPCFAQEPALRAAFRKLKELFPAAMFPPIWFVAGHGGAGGMVEHEGVIIALERFGAREPAHTTMINETGLSSIAKCSGARAGFAWLLKSRPVPALLAES